MTPPDEVRAAMAATVLEATSLIRFANETHKEYALRKYEHVYQSAYASGSAARKESILGIVRDEHNAWCESIAIGVRNEGDYSDGGRRACKDIISRIEKE